MRRWALSATLLCLGLVAVPSAHAVVGGQTATRDFPYMVALRYDGELRCGASLIGSDRVLTAAHCVTGDGGAPLPVERLSFVVGRKQLEGPGGEVIGAAQVTVHERFDSEMRNDVAIVRLAKPTTVRHVRLADPARQRDLWAPGRPATVTGWGANASLVLVSSGGTNDLQEVTVPMRSDQECADSSPYVIDAAVMVCAGERQGGKDSCQGDSGGPLVVPDSSGTLVQVGVVSFGFGCGFPQQYGVYSRVADRALYDWIVARVPSAAAVVPPDDATPRPGGSNPPPSGGSSTPGERARLSFGAARRDRRGLLLPVTASGPVRGLTVTLTQQRGGRTVVLAKVRVARLTGQRTVRLSLRRRLARVRVRLRATDADGRVVHGSGALRVQKVN